MARYIKVNPKVAQYLRLESDRNRVKDGNYLLWQADMLAFGPLTQLGETLAAIGGIALLPHEARQEQDGIVNRALPVAEDARFVIEQPAGNTPSDEAADVEPGADEEQPAVDAEAEAQPTDEEQPAEDAGETAPGDAEANEETTNKEKEVADE